MIAFADFATEVHPDPHRPAPSEHVKLAGVRWYGRGLFVREERLGSEIKGRCYPLQPGMLVYNRLFAWKSAFAVVTPEFCGVHVSNEFPQFQLDELTVDAGFIQVLCASEPFAAMAAGKSTGTTAVSRNRLRQIDLMSLTIPLPPLNEQRVMLRAYQIKIDRADALSRRATRIRSAAWMAFEEVLGATSSPVAVSRAVSISRFASMSRWDDARVDSGPALRWPVVSLGDYADIRLGCQVPRRGTHGPGVSRPYLRAANVQRGRFDLSDVKNMRVTERIATALTIRHDDLLFVEGNSQEEVGRAAVWNRQGEYIFQNSLIRARTNRSMLDPWFTCAWFNCEAGRRYFQTSATTTTGTLWHIGAGKTANAPVPLPPISIQRKLAKDLWSALDDAADNEQQAHALRTHASAELANSVFGQAAPGPA